MSCPDCFTGHIHIGTPEGSVQEIHGLPTYVSTPGGVPKGVIVYIPDIMGWEFPNNRLLADRYAKKGGFLVYVPDFMGGRAPPPVMAELMLRIMKPANWFITMLLKPIWICRVLGMIVAWFIFNPQFISKSRVFKFVRALRSSPPPYPTPSLMIGAVGFCWGGKYATLLTHDTPETRVSIDGIQRPLIDCAFIAHPSLLSMPGDIQKVRLPLSVAVGHDDIAMSGGGVRQMEGILKKKDNCEIAIINGAKHGFAVRMDPIDEIQMANAELAEAQAISWFTKWLHS